MLHHCTYISFKPKFISTCNLSDTAISSSNLQNWFNNLSWKITIMKHDSGS